MAKTKWIVPTIAIVLCAASLVGAAYAAYTATLTDTETMDTTNSYTTLSLGTNTLTREIDLDWDTATVQANGGTPATEWTLQNQTFQLGGFKIAQTNVNTSASASYDLNVRNLTVEYDGAEVSGFTIEIYDNSSYTGEPVASFTELSYNSTYYVLLKYNGGLTPLTTDEDPEDLEISYEIYAEAN